MKKTNKDYGWVLILIILGAAVLSASCSPSRHLKKQRPTNPYFTLNNDTIPDYLIVNNQILMFEKQR
jgi:hypothetical protein